MDGGGGVTSPRADNAAQSRTDDAENCEFTLHAYEPESDRTEDDGCADFDALDLDVEDGYLGVEGCRPASATSEEYPDDGVPCERGGQCEREIADSSRQPHDKIQRGVRSLWLHPTKAAEKGAASSAVVRETLSGLIIHGVFVAVLCGIVFGMTNSSAYYFGNLVQSTLVDAPFPGVRSGSFRSMSAPADFWKFAGPDGILVRELYGFNGSSGRSTSSGRNSSTAAAATGNASAWYAVARPSTLLRQQSYLVGPVQLRQFRVRNDSCEPYVDFADETSDCYAVYSTATEDRQPFGSGGKWTYSAADELDWWQSPYQGKVVSYPGGGYVAKVSGTSAQQTSAALRQLMTLGWIDNATRAVLVEFTLYNANSNLFCFVRLVTELPPTGGTITSFEIRTVKLLRYVTTGDFVVLGCEVIFIVFFIYFVTEAVMRVKRLGWRRYLRDAWNWFDWVIILMSAACVALNSYRTYVVDAYLDSTMPSSFTAAPYDLLSYWQIQFDYVSAVELFFAWLKVFRYIKLNRPLAQMATTLDRCRSDLVAFSVMFIVVFLAFAQLAFLIFGCRVQGFSSFSETCISLVRMILGDVSIHELEIANRVLGPLFFIVYTFIIFFILLNMFLAIVCEAYADARVHVVTAKHEYNVTSYLKKQYSKMADKLSMTKGALNMAAVQGSRSAACRSANAGHSAAEGFDRVEEEDLGLHRQRGGRDGHSHRPRARARSRPSGSSSYTSRGDSDDYGDCCYEDDDDDGGTSSSTGAPRGAAAGGGAAAQHRLPAGQRGCGSGCSGGGGGGGNGLAQEEFTVLTRRVDRMEHSIGSIVSKIDAVLVKLEAIEKAKARRKETLGKLLDGFNESADGRTEEVKRDQMEELVRLELQRMTEGMDALYEA